MLAALSVGLLALAGCATDYPDGPSAPPSAVVTGSSSAQQVQALPTRVVIPSLKIDGSLITVGLNADNTVEVPDVKTPQQGAWFRYSAIPGEDGPAILLAHVNGNHKPGLFSHLADATEGAQVRVYLSNGTQVYYKVTRVVTAAKSSFPTREVYGATPGSEIRLITCGGVFDSTARSYESNVIVFGVLEQGVDSH